MVNFESGPLLLDCVRSLLADADSTVGGAGALEVVVVDNGSADGSVADAARRAARTSLVVDPGGNVGYAAAANRGIAATTAPVVAVSNADLVVEPGTAAAMLARFDAEADLAAVGPALFNPDGSQYPSARAHASTVDAVGHAVLGRLFPRNRFTRRYRQLDARWDRPRDVDWVSGALDVPPPQRARLGRRVGRALLHVHGGRRPLLAPAPPRVAGGVRAVRAG